MYFDYSKLHSIVMASKMVTSTWDYIEKVMTKNLVVTSAVVSLFIAKMNLLKSLFIFVIEQNSLNIFTKSALIAGAGRLFSMGTL